MSARDRSESRFESHGEVTRPDRESLRAVDSDGDANPHARPAHNLAPLRAGGTSVAWQTPLTDLNNDNK